MLLAIDVGNTNTVLGLYRLANGPAKPTAQSGGPSLERSDLSGEAKSSRTSAPELLAHWRVTTPRTVTSDEVGILLGDLFALRSLSLSDVTGVIVASVVPPIDSILRRALETYCRVKPLFVEPGVRTGVPILTDSPAEVGADRIVNCVAAHAFFSEPVPAKSTPEPRTSNPEPHPSIIVVDLGTATTFDVVTPRGEFAGGAIAPGLGISADALCTRAARLPRVDIRKPARVIGTGTVDNLQIGLYFGYIGLVDGILARMVAELGPDTKIVATGGLASLIAGGSKYISHVDEHLTLTGLRLIYERNERSDRNSDRSHARAKPSS
jgi:type III pantothenate kinase